jgi:hypothetical protein
VGDFIGAIGRNVSGLVGGSIHALSTAWDTIVGTLQVWFPGPLFPIVMIGTAVAVVWLLRKTVL